MISPVVALRLRLLVLALGLALLAACSGVPAPGTARRTVTVSAASSLRTVMLEAGAKFRMARPGTDVRFNFGASNLLARQLREGAPVDLFISADERAMDEVQAGGRARSREPAAAGIEQAGRDRPGGSPLRAEEPRRPARGRHRADRAVRQRGPGRPLRARLACREGGALRDRGASREARGCPGHPGDGRVGECGRRVRLPHRRPRVDTGDRRVRGARGRGPQDPLLRGRAPGRPGAAGGAGAPGVPGDEAGPGAVRTGRVRAGRGGGGAGR